MKPNVFMSISQTPVDFPSIHEADAYIERVFEKAFHLSQDGITAALHSERPAGDPLYTIQGMVGWWLCKEYRYLPYPQTAAEMFAFRSERYAHPGIKALVNFKEDE